VPSPQQTITVTNSGNADLNIQNASIDAGPFFVTNHCGSPVVPGNTCQLSVAFTRTEVGFASATMKVVSNSSVPSQVIWLTGSAQEGFQLATQGNVPAMQTVTSGATATYTLFAQSDGLATTVTFRLHRRPAIRGVCGKSTKRIASPQRPDTGNRDRHDQPDIRASK